MRNQFFGDVNDYIKYGLLRAICDPQQLPLAVCWMLTVDGDTNDGRRTGYLDQPQSWRHMDPHLYDLLGAAVRAKRRTVTWAREHHLLPEACYHERIVPPGGPEREAYFGELWEIAPHSQIVFFDPDIGIEVPSVGYYSRRSPQYVCWSELREAYDRGLSVLVYQHYPRKKHDIFAAETIAELGQRLQAEDVWGYSTSSVLFLLAAQPRHTDLVAARSQQFAMRWGAYVHVVESSAEPTEF
jgi:hypothetical protein